MNLIGIGLIALAVVWAASLFVRHTSSDTKVGLFFLIGVLFAVLYVWHLVEDARYLYPSTDVPRPSTDVPPHKMTEEDCEPGPWRDYQNYADRAVCDRVQGKKNAGKQ